MPSPIRDAIALAIFQHAHDRESVELVLKGWQ